MQEKLITRMLDKEGNVLELLVDCDCGEIIEKEEFHLNTIITCPKCNQQIKLVGINDAY